MLVNDIQTMATLSTMPHNKSRHYSMQYACAMKYTNNLSSISRIPRTLCRGIPTKKEGGELRTICPVHLLNTHATDGAAMLAIRRALDVKMLSTQDKREGDGLILVHGNLRVDHRVF